MNDLTTAIARDLSIESFQGESSEDYLFRLCYSALGAHMLASAAGPNGDGISKKSQTETIQRLIDLCQRILGVQKRCFTSDQDDCSTHFRKVYEETGYLAVDDKNNSVIARYGRTVETSGGHLYFGLPTVVSRMVGLGVYTNTPGDQHDLFDTFMRDTCSVSDYIRALYNPLDFEERDIDVSDLEFFNPLLKKPPSASWEKGLKVQCTLAKSISTRTIFRIFCADSKSPLLFADLPFEPDKGRLTSYDLRRMYIALKAFYREPAVAWLNFLDQTHCEIALSVHLPTREYYFLLLSSWPKNFTFNRKKFVTRIEFLPTIEKVLSNIGIKIIRRKDNV